MFAVEPAYTRPLGGSKLAVTDDRPGTHCPRLAACAYNPRRLETGRHDPTLAMLETLTKALTVRVEELRNEEE